MSNSSLPLGIDVSNHQGTIDWAQVHSAGCQFAFMKATESNTFKDAYFFRNWENARYFGIPRGAYHFGRPATNPDARVEADHFINYVTSLGPLEVGDMLVLDMEEDGYDDYGSWTLYWLQIIESYVGFKPLLYTARNYINTLNLNNPELKEYGLWLAAWQQTFPMTPAPWNVTAFWQYTDKGRMPGVQGNCDLNRFNGTPDRIKLYGKPESIVEPIPEPEPSIISFDSNIDVHNQPDKWSCSIESTSWFLRSMGIDTNRQQLERQMVPSVVSKEDGLKLGTGEGLAVYLNGRWGDQIGLHVNHAPVTFDDVWAGAGVNPTMVGGVGWNHWVGVRGRNNDGTLSLANPAPVFKGIGPKINKEQWDRLGPFHAVWVDRLSHLNTETPPHQIDVTAIEERLKAMEVELKEIKTLSELGLDDISSIRRLIGPNPPS